MFREAQNQLSQYIDSSLPEAELREFLMEASQKFAQNQQDNNSLADLDQVMELLVISVFYVRDTPYSELKSLSQVEREKREIDTRHVLGILNHSVATVSEQVDPTRLDILFEKKIIEKMDKNLAAIFSIKPDIFPKLKIYIDRLSSARDDLNVIQVDESNKELEEYRTNPSVLMSGSIVPIAYLITQVDLGKINICLITEIIYRQEIGTSAFFKYVSEYNLKRPHIFFIVEMSDHQNITAYHRSSFNNRPIIRVEDARQ